MIRAIIVDDEKSGIDSLLGLINSLDFDIEIVGTFMNVKDAELGIKDLKPDLIFLDIEIGSESGFDLLNSLTDLIFNFDVIFTTAFVNYALRAIKFAALDFLLKPIAKEDLQLSIQKHLEKSKIEQSFIKRYEIYRHSTHINHKEKQKLALPTRDGYDFISIDDIIYCEADGAYTRFHLRKKNELLVSKKLKDYEDILTEYDFFRVHHSFLINISEIEKYIKGEGGIVLMSDGSSIDVSKRKKESFLKAISLKNK